MDVLGKSILAFLALLVFAMPVYLALKKYSFIKFYLISLAFIIPLLFVAAYWPHLYTDLRLQAMGFDFQGMSDAERIRNVAPELRDKATELYWSGMGVGWPLTAILWVIILSPYPLAIWLIKKVGQYFVGKYT
jgi:hypothetical protein